MLKRPLAAVTLRVWPYCSSMPRIDNNYHYILACLECRKVFVMTFLVLPVDRRRNQVVNSRLPGRIGE